MPQEELTGNLKRQALLVLLLSVGLNATGQLFFKGANLAVAGDAFWTLFLRYEIWLGLFLYGLSAIAWLWVLSRAQLSFAYPILATSFPIVVGLSAVIHGETVTVLRWLGIALIIGGVSLLART